MNCVVCQIGTVKPGQKMLFFGKTGHYAILQDVSCDVCDTCDEAYLSPETAKEVMSQARQMTESTQLVEVAPARAA